MGYLSLFKEVLRHQTEDFLKNKNYKQIICHVTSKQLNYTYLLSTEQIYHVVNFLTWKNTLLTRSAV